MWACARVVLLWEAEEQRKKKSWFAPACSRVVRSVRAIPRVGLARVWACVFLAGWLAEMMKRQKCFEAALAVLASVRVFQSLSVCFALGRSGE